MKQKKPKIFVITVNYNNGLITLDCLRSFDKVDQSGSDLSFVVVDNGSSDDASKRLSKQAKHVKIIRSETNLGFAGGNNLGINYALKNRADYILLINNDATVENKNFFIKLLEAKGDIVSPLVKYRQGGAVLYDFGGKVDYIFGRNTHLHVLPNVSPDYFSGVCLFIKTKVIKKIGSLDDRYFLYYEDADFCLRAKKEGFTLGFCPQSSIFHHLSISANKFGKKKISILANSHLRFCRRHLPVISTPFYFAFNLYLRLKTLFP